MPARTTTKRAKPKNPLVILREKAKVSQVTMARVMGVTLDMLDRAEQGLEEDLTTAIRSGLTALGVDAAQMNEVYKRSRGDEPEITLADVRKRLAKA